MDRSDAIGNEETFARTDNRMLETYLISGCTQSPFEYIPFHRRNPDGDTLHQS